MCLWGEAGLGLLKNKKNIILPKHNVGCNIGIYLPNDINLIDVSYQNNATKNGATCDLLEHMKRGGELVSRHEIGLCDRRGFIECRAGHTHLDRHSAAAFRVQTVGTTLDENVPEAASSGRSSAHRPGD